MGDVEIVEGSLPIPSRNNRNTYPDYIKDEARKFYVLGYSLTQISRSINVPISTIHDWIKCREWDVNPDDVERLKDRLVNNLYTNASHLGEQAMQPEKIESSSTLQLATAMGIMMSKAEVLENQSKLKGSNYFIYVNNADTKRNNAESIKDKLDQLDQEIQSLDN